MGRDLKDEFRPLGFDNISIHSPRVGRDHNGLKQFDVVKLAKQNPEIMPPLPYRSTAKSAGYDVFAPFTITLQPNEEAKIPTFIKAYMNDGEVLKAYPRSGLGFKYYCRLANTVGIIDSDYADNEANEGHIFIKLRNEGDEPMTINKGEAMCQFIFEKFLLVAGDSFNKGNKRIGGFGSTTSQKD